MLRHTVFENVIPIEVCDYIKNFFDTRNDLHVVKSNNPNVIKINHPWKHLKTVLDPILSRFFKTHNGNGGNIYKHTNVYTTHVDSFEPHQMINALMPIYIPPSDEQQHFVVFDQWVDNGFGQTWYGDRNDIKDHGDFDFNKKLAQTPFNDSRVYNKTDCNVDKEFYEKYLDTSCHKPEYFKGLTGTAYEFKPGNLILFNSNQLHTTGRLVSDWKMGLHINFDGSLEDLLIR
jgi:hypothetical protein